MTALTHREALLRGWEAGADEYLFKPFHPTELMTRIRMILVSVEERKKAEDNRKRYTEQLERANKELDAFSYSVSHDLRAPLRAIDGFTKILIEDYAEGMSQEALTYLGRVRDNSQQMGRLIDDLLAFSRMTRAAMRRSRINLEALIDDSRALFNAETKDRKISWSVASLPEVEGDPAMMRLVLQNLISNAIKYTRTRSQAEIEIGFTAQQEHYTFYVRDNGVGFDMDYKDKLFGIFQRLHPSEEFEGTGIGLANVLRIISRHGGKVWAEGDIEKGATFYFTLPRQHIESVAPEVTQ